ncbi:MAG: glycosyltransferase family 4 protein [bacterium]|nr:glycosyltransferase family 4 protein [bacterium]
MRLLITTQAVDLDDPVLGFFHRWVEEFSKHCESVHIICLKEGRHNLPKNVFVHSLGKPSFAEASQGEGNRFFSRIKYVWNFYRYIWTFRKEYDAVFVHMNQEYVLLGGKFWWLLGKRVILWRNHKKGSIFTRIAGLLSHTVCYTSTAAYVASFKNAVQMPIGIDTDFFKPSGNAEPHSLLFLGRLDAVKKPDVFLHAMEILRRDGNGAHADVYGDPTPGREDFARKLKTDFSSLKRVLFHAGVRNDETSAIYNAHAIYVNLTPSGSFDKTIGEAMACGSVVVAANDAVQSVVPQALMVDPQSPESVAAGLRTALALSEDKRKEFAHNMRQYVVNEHSLTLLTERVFGILTA